MSHLTHFCVLNNSFFISEISIRNHQMKGAKGWFRISARCKTYPLCNKQGGAAGSWPAPERRARRLNFAGTGFTGGEA